jgi:energy-coupling factor transport system permease protein
VAKTVPIFTAYSPRGTWIDRLDPRTKLAWLMLVALLSLFNSDWQLLLALLCLIVGLSLWNRQRISAFAGPFLVIGIVGLQLLIVQLIFCRQGAVIWQHGMFMVYSEAAPLALTGALRVGVIFLAATQFLGWTAPGDVVLMFVQMKMPYRYAMLAGLALRFLPLMERELADIYESQAARGLPLYSTLQKIRGLIPVTMPFLFRSFRRAGETALAMELRGFGRQKERTFLKDLRFSSPELAAILLMCALAGIDLWLRVRVLLP